MKVWLAVPVLLSFGATNVCAQTAPAKNNAAQAPTKQKPAAPAVPPTPAAAAAGKIDPAKEADIRKLLELVGTKALFVQSMDGMSKSMKPMLTNSLPPGDYREKLVDLFFNKFSSKMDVQHLLDLAVPIYDKHFSHQEVRSLIDFYQTPLGQKTVSTLPMLTAELQEEGRKWGESLGRDSMQEVLAEHPDLLEAMTAAQKSSGSSNQ
jgi:uncharacterized protein